MSGQPVYRIFFFLLLMYRFCSSHMDFVKEKETHFKSNDAERIN